MDFYVLIREIAVYRHVSKVYKSETVRVNAAQQESATNQRFGDRDQTSAPGIGFFPGGFCRALPAGSSLHLTDRGGKKATHSERPVAHCRGLAVPARGVHGACSAAILAGATGSNAVRWPCFGRLTSGPSQRGRNASAHLRHFACSDAMVASTPASIAAHDPSAKGSCQ